MATGDVKGGLRKLQSCLRSVRFPSEVDYQGLSRGDPSSFLPIVSYTFTSFSPAVAELLVERGIELTGKNDLSFIESVYKVLRDVFRYKPLLTKQQFLQFGFAERKLSLLCDIISFILDKHKQLTKGTKSVSPARRRMLTHNDSKSSPCSPPVSTTRTTPTRRLVRSTSLVEKHPSRGVSTQSSFSSDVQEEEDGGSPRDEDVRQPAAHTECECGSSLRAVEAALQETVSRLQEQINVLQLRVQALESNATGTVCIEGALLQELDNRVLLLETGMQLYRNKDPARTEEPENMKIRNAADPVEVDSHGDTPTCIPTSSSSGENIKERLERIANMMKDTSSLLKNKEPSI